MKDAAISSDEANRKYQPEDDIEKSHYYSESNQKMIKESFST